jgi:hypothetical protein
MGRRCGFRCSRCGFVVSPVEDPEFCEDCGEEINFGDGRSICEECEYELDRAEMEKDWANTVEEPVWYTLSELIERSTIPEKPWEELMALAQMLHDLRISDSNELMRKLGAVYVADDSAPLRGQYWWAGNEREEDRFHGEIGAGHAPKEAKEPRLSSRRQAIMAQKERKNEGH